MMPRRHGFPGQHMFVLPEPVRASARTHPLLRGLHVTDAGYFPTAKKHLVGRPGGAPTSLVILCMKGKGWVTSEGQTFSIEEGDWIWLPANRPHAYGSGEVDSWTITWAHFDGDEVDSWQELISSHASSAVPVVGLPRDRLDEVALELVYGALERGYALVNQVDAAAALRRSLATVARLAHSPRSARDVHDRIAASISYLQRNWQRPHRLKELAVNAGMSVTYYSMLFRRQTGFAPIDFLIRLRIQHAARLLDTTRLSVQEIAEATGYPDPYYFTRTFRRIMGCPPARYRRVQKG